MNLATRFRGLLLVFAIVGGDLIVLSAAEPSTCPVRFSAKMLGIDTNEGIDIADFNNDGKLDLVAGRNWYAAPKFVPSPVRPIEDWNQYAESNGDFAYDVDGDGWNDVIAGSFLPTEVYWYRNPGAEALALGQMWTKILLVDTGRSHNEASFMRDIDGDGTPEWITNSWNMDSPMLVWKLAKQEETTEKKQGDRNVAETIVSYTLTEHVIGELKNGHGIAFGDINNDGREDILVGTGWYERPEGDPLATTWAFHPDWDRLHASCPMIVRDVDGDGINDLIWGRGHDFGLYWWQGQSCTDEEGRLKFEEHLIDDSYSQPHALELADLDGDGEQEVITGKRVRAHNGKDPGGAEPGCVYYYKWNAKTRSFDRFDIDVSGRVGIGLQIRTADLNGDGRLDIAVAGKSGTFILFNEGP